MASRNRTKSNSTDLCGLYKIIRPEASTLQKSQEDYMQRAPNLSICLPGSDLFKRGICKSNSTCAMASQGILL